MTESAYKLRWRSGRLPWAQRNYGAGPIRKRALIRAISSERMGSVQNQNLPMNYNELIQLFFERSNAAQWYWTLYVVIVGGLLAFSSQRQQRDFFTTMLVTVLFCIFAYKNLDALQDTTQQRLATLDAIKRTTPAVAPGAIDVKP